MAIITRSSVQRERKLKVFKQIKRNIETNLLNKNESFLNNW